MHPVPRPHRRPRDRRLRFLTALGVLATLVTGYLAVLAASPAAAAPVLLSQGRPATASSSEGAAMGAGAAVDGNTGTRWSSAFSDPQWIQVDLGSAQAISQVVLNWEAAYGRGLHPIQTSTNGTTWTTIHTTTDRHRRRADPPGDRHRPLRADERHRPRHRLRLLAVGVPGLRRDHAPPPTRRCGTTQRRAGQARHRLVHRERRHPRQRRRRRQRRHPLVQRLRRPAVAPGRPRAAPQSICQRRAELGGRLRHGLHRSRPPPNGTTWTTIYTDHHRHRRHPDPRPSPAAAGTCG